MKKYVLCGIILFMVSGVIKAQAVQTDNEQLIKQTALNYAEGFYNGEVERMEKAIHPDLNKAYLAPIRRSGRSAMSYSTYSQLIEYTRAKVGVLPKEKQNISVSVLNIDGTVANAKVTSASFNDYLQMVNFEGDWKIVNVLWAAPGLAAGKTADLKPDQENEAITQSVLNYAEGLYAVDVKKIETSCHPEFNRILLNRLPSTNKTVIIRQRLQGAIESALAKVNKMDEINRHYKVEILDMMNGMAVAKLSTPSRFDYLQLIKTDNQWKVFNVIAKNNDNMDINAALPAIVNDPMPDFTLPLFNGGEFSLSKNKGKNILFIFPRGWTVTQWCTYCPYAYLEFAELEKKLNIKKKYDLEIVFVMPYSKERIADWFNKFSFALQTLETLKNPAGQKTAVQAGYAEILKKRFPKKFEVNKDEVAKYLPVVVDEDRTLSTKLGLFTNFWDGVSSEQNIPAAIVVDKKGIVKLKYLSQVTEDRPDSGYLLEVVKNLK